MVRKNLAVCAAVVAVGCPFVLSQRAWAAAVTLTGNDPLGSSSWNTGLNWSDSTAPSAANDYTVGSGLTLRTPDSVAGTVFAGNSLTLQGGILMKHNTNTSVSANLIVSGTSAAITNGVGGTDEGFGGTITLNAASLLSFTTAETNRTISLSADVSGSGNISKTGGHTLILSGNNSFGSGTLNYGSGTTDAGAIRLASANALGNYTTVNLTGNNGGADRIELTGSINFNTYNITTSGRANQQTTGATLVNISGNNTWNGNITINNTGGAYGIRSDAGTLTIAGNVLNGIANTRTWDLGGAGNILVNGIIDENGGAGNLALTKFGTGTLTLAGANAYNGSTVISAGTLAVGNGGTTGQLGGGSVTNSSVLTFNRSNAMTVGNLIAGAGAVNQNGSGATTLTNANSYDGLTTINDGVLEIQNASALGSTAAGTRIVGNSADGQLALSGSITTSAEALTLEARQGAAINAAHLENLSGNNTFSGAITFDVGGSDYNFDSASGTLTLTGGIVFTPGSGTRNIKLTGAGNGVFSGGAIAMNPAATTNAIYKSGAGTWTLSSTITGVDLVNVNGGTLKMGAENIMASESALSLSTGAFDANSLNQTFQSIRFAGGSIANAAASGKTLSLNATGDAIIYATGAGPTLNATLTGATGGRVVTSGFSGSASYDGSLDLGGQIREFSIADTNAGGSDMFFNGKITNGGILKTGAGTLKFLSTSNSFSTLEIQNGAVFVQFAGNHLPDNLAVNINGASAALSITANDETVGTVKLTDGLITGDSVLSATSFDVRNGSSVIVLGGAAATLTKNTSGTVTLSAANTYGGNTTVNLGVLNVTGALANNGSDKVFIAADAEGDFSSGTEATLSRAVAASASYTGLGSSITSSMMTAADLLGGTNGTAGTQTLSMGWRDKASTSGEVHAELLLSDVLSVTGIDGSVFVLQMNYADFAGDVSLASSGLLHLAWLDTSDNTWKNAIEGNHGSNIGATNVFGSWAGAGGSTLALGAWGVDTDNNVVWAVLDHNSQFAVLAPTPLALPAGLMLMGALAMRRRR
ncbi:MAG: hypothetical protein GC162_09175 [Planctomycetes bacterium]|nr:hypothetical protein [Planctomycetota bacterium]